MILQTKTLHLRTSASPPWLCVLQSARWSAANATGRKNPCGAREAENSLLLWRVTFSVSLRLDSPAWNRCEKAEDQPFHAPDDHDWNILFLFDMLPHCFYSGACNALSFSLHANVTDKLWRLHVKCYLHCLRVLGLGGERRWSATDEELLCEGEKSTWWRQNGLTPPTSSPSWRGKHWKVEPNTSAYCHVRLEICN